MVYDRRYDERTLRFEASGALLKASLVLRDKETDSWWSIMRGTAIGGTMKGARLHETALGEKMRWGDWRALHPDTVVLSVNGRTHDLRNPYDDYFASGATFRSIAAGDDRLPPKTPVFVFRSRERAFAIPAASVEGGRFVDVPGEGPLLRLFLWRRPGAPLFEGTRAYVTDEEGGARTGDAIEADLRASAERLPGFDTYWYSWVLLNPETVLLLAD